MNKVRQWSLLTAVAVVVVLAAGWYLLVSPQRAQATKLNHDAAGQAASTAQLRNDLAALKAQARDLPKKQARLAEISAKVPGNPELPSLIRGLSDAADKAGVDLVSLAPSAPVAVAATTAAVRPSVGATAASAPAPALSAIPLKVVVKGGFFQLEQFVSNLESLPRAFLVNELGLGTDGAPGSTSSTTTAPTTSSAAATPAKPADSLTATITAQVFTAPAATTSAAPTKPAPVAPAPPSK